MRRYIDTRASDDVYATRSEFIRNLIRRDMQDWAVVRDAAQGLMHALRVNDVGVSFLLVRRIESELGHLHREDDEAPASAKSPTLLTLVDAIGKAREKMRKAINELETSCPDAVAATDTGLADMMKRLVQNVAIAGV